MTDAELNRIEKKKSVTHVHITKRGSYYLPNCCGYTEYKAKAGVYLKTDAIGQAKSCRDLMLWPIDIVKHNQLIIDEVKLLLQNTI